MDVVRELLKAKPSIIDVHSKNNASALYIASENGYLDVVRELLKAKPSLIDVVTDISWSALHVASLNGHLDVVRELLKEKPSIIDVVAKDNRSALHMASQECNLEVVRELLKAKPSLANISALAFAFAKRKTAKGSKKDRSNVVALLLDAMAEVSITKTIPDHPQHPLVATPPDGRRGYASPEFECNLCKASMLGPCFHCEECKFDVCAKCCVLYHVMAVTTVGTTKTLPGHQHALVVTHPNNRGYLRFNCDLCKTNHFGIAFHCKERKFDVCAKCADDEAAIAKKWADTDDALRYNKEEDR